MAGWLLQVNLKQPITMWFDERSTALYVVLTLSFRQLWYRKIAYLQVFSSKKTRLIELTTLAGQLQHICLLPDYIELSRSCQLQHINTQRNAEQVKWVSLCEAENHLLCTSQGLKLFICKSVFRDSSVCAYMFVFADGEKESSFNHQ